MDMYSLEDDGNDLFITQQSPSDKSDRNVTKSVFGDVADFQSPCISLVIQQHYSDISNDDFMDIPSSQINQNLENDYKR